MVDRVERNLARQVHDVADPHGLRIRANGLGRLIRVNDLADDAHRETPELLRLRPRDRAAMAPRLYA